MAAVARPPVIVKLGGSLITRKHEKEKIRPKVLARLCREIAAIDDPPLVVLHGAGSFGHPGARAFGLDRAPEDDRSLAGRARGAAIVASETRRLHLAVLRELVRVGASPLSVPLSTHARNREGGLATIDPRPIAESLAAGSMPVSFGDVVPDEAWGFSILSADTIAAALVPLLRPSRVVFASDVPGILEPGTTGRRAVVPEITDEVVERLGKGPPTLDAMGGVLGKARAMRAIARSGVDAVLISGLTDGAVSRAIRGDAVYGSWAHASSR